MYTNLFYLGIFLALVGNVRGKDLSESKDVTGGVGTVKPDQKIENEQYKDEKIDLINKHNRGITWSKRNLKGLNLDLDQRDIYFVILDKLQSLINTEKTYLVNEKRHIGRWRNSNYLMDALKGKSKSDRQALIDRNVGLMWTKRNPDQSPDDDVKDMALDFVEHTEYLIQQMKDHLFPLVKDDDMMGSSDVKSKEETVTSTKDAFEDVSHSRRKRFIGRSRNSNYIWSKKLNGEDIRKLLRKHWEMNWNKRTDRNV